MSLKREQTSKLCKVDFTLSKIAAEFLSLRQEVESNGVTEIYQEFDPFNEDYPLKMLKQHEIQANNWVVTKLIKSFEHTSRALKDKRVELNTQWTQRWGRGYLSTARNLVFSLIDPAYLDEKTKLATRLRDLNDYQDRLLVLRQCIEAWKNQ